MEDPRRARGGGRGGKEGRARGGGRRETRVGEGSTARAVGRAGTARSGVGWQARAGRRGLLVRRVAAGRPVVAASGRRAEKRGGAGGWVVEGEYAPTSASGGDTALGATVFPRPSAPVVSCALSPRVDGELERTARHLRLRLRNCERADNDEEERFVSVAFGTPAVRARAATRPVRRVGFAGRRVWARARGRRASRSREGDGERGMRGGGRTSRCRGRRERPDAARPRRARKTPRVATGRPATGRRARGRPGDDARGRRRRRGPGGGHHVRRSTDRRARPVSAARNRTRGGTLTSCSRPVFSTPDESQERLVTSDAPQIDLSVSDSRVDALTQK